MSPDLLWKLLVFTAAVLAVIGVYSLLTDLLLRDRSRLKQRLDTEFRPDSSLPTRSPLFKNLQQLTAEVEADEELIQGPRQRLEALVKESGLNLTLRRLLTIAAATALALGLLGVLLRDSWLFGALLAVIGGSAPLLYVNRKRNLRLEKLLAQLPDAFDLMARVIRAGQSMTQAMQGVADEFSEPIGPEFAYCYEQQNLGLPPEIALRNLAHRTGVVEIKILVLALLVQQQTGGNLTILLETLATMVRERLRMRGKIKALTAQGRAQARFLLALPVVMFFGIMLLNRSYAQVLLDHPAMIVGMVISMTLGALWIRKIVNFEF